MIEQDTINIQRYKLMMLDLGFPSTIKTIVDWDFSPEELIKEIECCIAAYKEANKTFLDKEG